jgi:hypothetical protein
MTMRRSELEEVRRLKRARQLGLTLEEMLEERLYMTRARLQELKRQRRKMENRIRRLETRSDH